MTQTTAAQSAASRANGAQSQGPLSGAGKARAAANSRKHGLCAKEFVLQTAEEQARFDAQLHELCFVHQAKNELEREACRHLAVAMWRRRVCDNLEREVMQGIEAGRVCAQAGGGGLPGLGTIARYRARIARDLKEARAELAELKTLRAQAFQAQMIKAKELASGTLLNELKGELGETGFGHFRDTVTPQDKLEQTNPAARGTQTATEVPADDHEGLNRRSKRYLEKMARKQNRKRR